MAKLINSNKQLEKLTINAIRAFTPKKPFRVMANNRHQYLAGWKGNFVFWINVSARKDGLGDQWSISIGLTSKEVANMHYYFYCNDPIPHFRDAIAFFILQYNFQF